MDNNIDLKMFNALVIDIDDEEKQGKIKIRILPFQQDVEESMLPWAIPFDSKCSENTLNMDLPQINSVIRVLVDKTWKRFYYLQNKYFYALFNFSKISDKLSTLSNVNTEYSNIIFRLYQDDALSFHNNKDSSHGYIHSNGSYVYVNSEGSVIVSSEKDIKCSVKGKQEYSGDGNIKLNSTKSGMLTIGNSIATLGGILAELMDDLANLVTQGSPSSQTSPQLTAQMNILKQKLNKVFN